MSRSTDRIEETTHNGRATQGDDRHWLEIIRKLPDVRTEKVASARNALTRPTPEEDDKLGACVDLIYEDLDDVDTGDNTHASG